jgi:hypothetical protein
MSEITLAHFSSDRGFECADSQARRAILRTSAIEMNKNPIAQTKIVKLPKLLKTGGAELASTIIEPKARELWLATLACGDVKNREAFHKVTECHAGSSNVSKGNMREPTIPNDHTRCRKAADRRRAALVITHANPSRQVIFTEHDANSASDSSVIRSIFIVGLPLDLY